MLEHNESLKNFADRITTFPTFKFLIDWEDNGNYVDESRFVLNRISGSQDKGEFISSLNSQDLTIELENSTGRFDPFVGEMKDYILPDRPCQLWLGYGGYNLQILEGRIQNFSFNDELKKLTIYVWDISDKFSETIYSNDLLVSKRTDELLTEIMNKLGIGSSEYDFDIGEIVVGVSFFGGETARVLIEKITQAERGRIFISNTGKLVFWSKTTAKRNAVNPVETLSTSKNIEKIDPSFNWDDLVKTVVVKSIQRKIANSLEVIFNLQVSEGLNAGQSKTFFCDYADQITLENFPATDVQTPISTTDYLANDSEDGTGTDRTADISISISKLANTSIVEITNNHSAPVYLTKLQLRGKPARVVSTIRLQRSSSVATVGKTLEIENDFIEKYDNAESVAFEELERREQINGKIFVDVLNAYPYIEVGDILEIEDKRNNTKKNYELIQRKFVFDKMIKQNLTLITALTPRYFLQSENLFLNDSVSISALDQYYYGRETQTETDPLLVLIYDNEKQFTLGD
jgi:hypothetical protein